MDLLITGLGMITSVGHDAATSCASIRAGLNRRCEINYYRTLETETMDSTPIIGCPVQGYTDGFNKVGRWIRLGLGCLEDLGASAMLPDRTHEEFWSKTGLVGVTPSCHDPRLGADERCTDKDVERAFLHPLLDVFDRPIAKSNLEIVCSGHCGAIAAVDSAPAMMAEKGLDRVIVVAVDSFLDPESLDWLDEHHRLKTGDLVSGLTPGEAGACFMLEAKRAALGRQAKILAATTTPALGKEQNHFFSDKPNQGVGLAGVLSQAIANTGAEAIFEGDVLSDMNGESWRAYELGAARVRVAKVLGERAAFTFPAEALGETGAASGAVALGIAVCMLRRGYALSDTVLILSSSEFGQVGALCIRTA